MRCLKSGVFEAKNGCLIVRGTREWLVFEPREPLCGAAPAGLVWNLRTKLPLEVTAAGVEREVCRA